MAASSAASQKRTPRACDECRRLKIRCESLRHSPDGEDFSNEVRRCRGCQSSGIECKFTGPIHKRGPPKGYLSALERRLNDAEALLGTLLCSKDPRAVTLMSDLRKDQLASSIMRRIASTEFGPQGRTEHARSAALHSAKTEPADFYVDSQGHLVFTSPSSMWQDYLDMRLNVDMKARINAKANLSSQVELSSVQSSCLSSDQADFSAPDVSDLFMPHCGTPPLPNTSAAHTSLPVVVPNPSSLLSFTTIPSYLTPVSSSQPMSSTIESNHFTEEINKNAWLAGDGHVLRTSLGL